MPQRSMTYETARCPICRYGVCPRSHNASIIEFSKCVRRHQVTKLFGFPSQPFCLRKGVTASVRPVCISTMVPYWSNASTLISRFRTSGISLIVSLSSRPPNRTRSVHHNIPIFGIGLRFRGKTLLFGCPLWVKSRHSHRKKPPWLYGQYSLRLARTRDVLPKLNHP